MQKILKKYLERLHDSIQKSALLSAYPPKRISTRIDLSRLSSISPSLPTNLLETLIYAKSASCTIQFQYDELPHAKQEIEDLKERNEPVPEYLQKNFDKLCEIAQLHDAFAKKMIKESDLVQRETGLRSLWLGYPLAFLSATTATGHSRSILAPIFLWPINIKASLRKQGEITIFRDDEATAPIYNKAFDYWCIRNLGINPEDPSKEALLEISKEELIPLINKIFQGFSKVPTFNTDSGLQKITPKAELKRIGSTNLLNSAILGLIKWENQAIMHDLEEMVKMEEFPSLTTTFLTGEGLDKNSIVERIPESDKYFVCKTDHCQQQAILDSRQKPGAIVHGPPGTGKSETIVNIVADSLAHGEKVLVVCQKRAAIDVVFERIKQAGLEALSMLVHDSNSDRVSVIESIKGQVDNLNLENSIETLRGSYRQRISTDIEILETKLDQYMEAVYACDPNTKKIYRDLKVLYLSIRERWNGLRESKQLADKLSKIDIEELNRIDHAIRLIAKLYFDANPDNNPWKYKSKDFVVNKFLLHDITEAFDQAIKQSNSLNLKVVSFNPFEVIPQDWNNFQLFLKECVSNFQTLKNESSYRELRSRTKGHSSNKNREDLQQLKVRFNELDLNTFKQTWHEALHDKDKVYLSRLLDYRNRYCRKPTGLWSVFDLGHKLSRRRFLHELRILEIDVLEGESDAFALHLKSEILWRDIQSSFHKVDAKEAIPKLSNSPNELEADCKSIENMIRNRELFFGIESLIDSSYGKSLSNLLDENDYEQFKVTLVNFLDFAKNAEELRKAVELIDGLSEWIDRGQIEKYKMSVWRGTPITEELQLYLNTIEKLKPLVQLDSELARLSPAHSDVINILKNEFSIARSSSTFNVASGDDLTGLWLDCFWLTIYSNACSVLENKYSILLSYSGELYEKDRLRLKELLLEKLSLESVAIHEGWKAKQNGQSTRTWKPILVTRGKNSKRLRQVVDLGSSKGLFDLRPVWMTNPNTACQIFPLIADYFDVVIFDEASQCPIEQALPLIFRSKRVIVAGDEKQLPPTSFFKSGFFTDENEEKHYEKPDDELSSEEVTERNMREALTESQIHSIDLLGAAKTILPDKYLNIHYRSLHPALVAFSNHAFYNGRLQVPFLGLMNGYLNEPPIVYLPINGIYQEQKNRDETEAVLKLVKDLWKNLDRPTIGIVTFNSEQRDLIDSRFQSECERDVVFSTLYDQERNRKDGKQDVGFFVKNLESVQGDERDVMIFSTTFGKSPEGAFHRRFGPISEEGGERRLNVAVTRAKKRMYVVTSMPIEQISDVLAVGGAHPGAGIGGREYFHVFMHYAKAVSDGNTDLQNQYLEQVRSLLGIAKSSVPTSGGSDSDFEIQVAERLTSAGYNVSSQIGESGFLIDLAIKHQNPALGYVLGIECDGATYHSSFPARMRDIWRQHVLESRGWNIHRIWSTDWWNNPESEIERIKRRIDVIYEKQEHTKNKYQHKETYADIFSMNSSSTDKDRKEEENGSLSSSSAGRSEKAVPSKEQMDYGNTSKIKIKEPFEPIHYGLSVAEVEAKEDDKKKGSSLLGVCLKCNRNYRARSGSYGPFLSCTNCGGTQQFSNLQLEKVADLDVKCPLHHVRLKLRVGRRGFFMGCPVYPRCVHTEKVKMKPEFS